MSTLYPILFAAVVVIVCLLGFAALLKAFYVKVPQGVALIVNGLGAKPRVHFTGAFVYPVIYKKEFMRISLLTLEINRKGKDGLICRDNLRADIAVAFYLKVNAVEKDVLRVAEAVGVDRASDTSRVNELFNAKFSEALKTVGKQFDMHQLFDDRQNFRDRIREVIGSDLNGYTLEDVAIDYLEQTPKTSLDPNNIFDSEGIRKITEITASHNIVTNEAERNQELAIKKKNVETREAALELERQQADAEARQLREIETIRAREQAETKKVQEEERLRVEQARIQTQQEIEVREENRQREVAVAERNRLRVIAIENERVQRARDLEAVAREREVELQTIEKEKVVEEERKNIANVIRERVAVEKTVAMEEERIKEVRLVSEADRLKQVEVITAQAMAEKNLVQQVKQAEADRDSAGFKAVAVTTLAQADLEAAAKQAEAKKRLAEGLEAEEAALGLAEARVRQAQADAREKEGLVEAEIIRQKLKAEAEGLAEKFSVMNNLGDTAREHEEFRLQLEKHLEEALAGLAASQEIARKQAEILSAALTKANIDIVSGDPAFYNSFAKSLSMGKAFDGFVEKSPAAKNMLEAVMDKLKGVNFDPVRLSQLADNLIAKGLGKN
ncbi:MAG: hypothetical protein LBM64_07405 [Deltaproteobacteria bacterium]|jgi:uncharacterized membrane protein YqiK|nr:hypothetical protein [Deltaproteobacteria bacterium]